MATDILHSFYMILRLFLFLLMMITSRYHNEFTLRSFFAFFPDTRSYFSEDNFKNERFQRSDTTGRTVSSQMWIDSSTDRCGQTSANGKEHLSFNAIARVKCNVQDVYDVIVSIKFIFKLLFILIFNPC